MWVWGAGAGSTEWWAWPISQRERLSLEQGSGVTSGRGVARTPRCRPRGCEVGIQAESRSRPEDSVMGGLGSPIRLLVAGEGSPGSG